MKLIVHGQAEFEVDDNILLPEIDNFLKRQGFRNVSNIHYDYEFIICTADYYGKKNRLNQQTIESPEWYRHRVAMEGMNHWERTAYNANLLNELCARNGREL